MSTLRGRCLVTNGSARVIAGAITNPPFTSGPLVSGSTYRITTFVAGDNFSNVGGTNVSGNIFKATGTTPLDWTHASTLEEIKDTFLDWSGVTLSRDIFYVPGLINVPGYENGQGYAITAFTDSLVSGSGFDELTISPVFNKPSGSVFFEIHTNFTAAGFVIIMYGDVETADAFNRNFLLAENLLGGGTPLTGGAIAIQNKTISGGEAGLDVITVTLSTPMPSVAPLSIMVPACMKVADGDANNPCIGISSADRYGFKIHLQSGAIPGQTYSCPYIPSL